MPERTTRESARRLTRKDRTHRAKRWALLGGGAVLAVGALGSGIDPALGVIGAIATGVAVLLALPGRDLAILRAELSEQRAVLALGPLRRDIVYPLNPAALCPENALFLLQQIQARRPRRVLEFGSGISTVLIARALREIDEKGHLDSLEHLESWYERTRQLVHAAGVSDVVRLHHSPLGPASGLEVPWYDLSVLPQDDPPYDLVLVDGPEGGSGEPLARLGGFLAVRERLAPDAVILLDDALRGGEREIVKRWQQVEPGLRATLHKSDTGMWMFERPGAGSRGPGTSGEA